MAVLTVNNLSRAATNLASALVAAASGGDSFPNTGAEIAVFKNTDSVAVTVTAVIQSTVDGQAVTSRTFVVPATTGLTAVGGFPTANYNDGNSRCNFTYSGVTALTVAILKPALT